MASKAIRSTRVRICALLITLAMQWHATYAADFELRDDLEATPSNTVVEIDVLSNDSLPAGSQVRQLDDIFNAENAFIKDGRVVVFEPAQDFVGVAGFSYLAGPSETDLQTANVRVDVQGGLSELFTARQVGAASVVLFYALLLSILLEFALHRVYEWRWFIRLCEGRGLKVPISVALGAVLVYSFKFDIVAELVTVFDLAKSKVEPSLWGYGITALIISGGSGTVFRLYRTLGLRVPASLDEAGRGVEEPRKFPRVRVLVNRGPEPAQGKGRSVDVLIDGALVATLGPTAKQFPVSKFGTTFPVEFGKDLIEFRVAISPYHPEDQSWVRRLRLTNLKKVEVHFDLEAKSPVTETDSSSEPREKSQADSPT